MIFLPSNSKVYVYSKGIDMRWGFDRLNRIIQEEMSHNIDHGDLFLFLGFNRRRLKGLCFDGSGLILFSKRTEKKSFMSVGEIEEDLELTREEFELLVHGSVLRKYYPKRRINV